MPFMCASWRSTFSAMLAVQALYLLGEPGAALPAAADQRHAWPVWRCCCWPPRPGSAARTTLYTLTDRRIVMRIGVVLTLTLNLPLRQIAGRFVQALGRTATATLPSNWPAVTASPTSTSGRTPAPGS
jgi:hypothetical protein